MRPRCAGSGVWLDPAGVGFGHISSIGMTQERSTHHIQVVLPAVAAFLRPLPLVLVACAAFLPAGSAYAGDISFGFTAQVASVDDPMSLFGGAFDGSPIITGQYTFDSDASSISTGLGLRYLAAFSAPLTFSVDGSSFEMTLTGANNNMIEVQNDAAIGAGFSRDFYNPFLDTTSWSIGGIAQGDVLRFDLSLGLDSTGTPDLLDSDDLPLTPPDITKAAGRTLEIAIFQSGTRAATVTSTVTALVPEPSTGLLLASGLAVVAARRRRAAKR
jgi:hypothetical protein